MSYGTWPMGGMFCGTKAGMSVMSKAVCHVKGCHVGHAVVVMWAVGWDAVWDMGEGGETKCDGKCVILKVIE